MIKKQIIFNIAGGVGKNIMATATVEAIKKQFPDREIIILSPYESVWLNNPNINMIIDITKTPNFYFSYIKDTDSLIFSKEPYLDTNYLYHRDNLIKIWCDLCKVPYNKEVPKLYFTNEEKEQVKRKLPQNNKPIFMIQTNGGAPNQNFPISWSRDMPLKLAEDIVSVMIERGFEPIHLRRADQFPLKNAPRFDGNMREAMCAISFSDKRLFIDSFAQHAAMAHNLPSIVLWNSNDPIVFGYNLHKNILPNKEKEFRHNIYSYLEKYDITGDISQCPYDTNNIFSIDEILKSFL